MKNKKIRLEDLEFNSLFRFKGSNTINRLILGFTEKSVLKFKYENTQTGEIFIKRNLKSNEWVTPILDNN